MSNTNHAGTIMHPQKRDKMQTPKRVKYLAVPALHNAGKQLLKPMQPIVAEKIRHAHSWKGAQVDGLPLDALFLVFQNPARFLPSSYPNPTRIPPLYRAHMLQPCAGASDLVGIHPLLWAFIAEVRQEKQA